MMSDISTLPSELIVSPVPLIGFSGLDVHKNPIHKTIWEAFSYNRKNDRAQIQFKLLPPNYDFPVSKPKRQSYEWYHPKGILKKNWMLKHLHVLPAVVVLFQDVEWNDNDWSEKQLQCASLMQTLKNSLQGQNTKIAIALLQKGTPLPPGEDLLATERNAHLASACDINPKMIFVLPHNDHLMGFTYRLESSFLELAQSYYTQMAKQIRLHRDQLTDAHMALKIRHQFKLGAIAEIRMDYPAAQKNYIQAYSHLDEIRIIDTNCLEIKTVAGFLNFKICKLMFRSAPRDAIAHFRAHVERFRTRTGFKELIFEHYAWLSLQYSAFAELFCDAIKFGLPALQVQHPGIYYHKAAEYMGKRKEVYLECAANTPETNVNTSTSYTSMFYSEFFGVRGSKIGDPITEHQAIALVQANEKNFNHSAAIITLLGQAMAQFKLYKCLRFRKKLAIDMAEEYLQCGDHPKALTLFSLMLSDYRVDKWFSLFTQVLRKTLQSAYLSAAVVDFVTCSIEAMSPKILIENKERLTLLDNLFRVLHSAPPLSQIQQSPAINQLWETTLANFRSPILIDLDHMTDLFECVVTFENPQIKHDQNVQVKLFIRSISEIPLPLNEFTIVLADSSLNFKLKTDHFIEVSDTDMLLDTHHDKDRKFIDPMVGLILQPKLCYKLVFSAGPFKFTENEELTILRVEMSMGSKPHRAILSQSTTLNKVHTFKAHDSHLDCMENIPVNSTCYIVPTFHLATQNNLNNQPMLTNEYFKAESIVSNPFEVAVQNVGVSITVPANYKNKVFITADLAKTSQHLQSSIEFDIGDLQRHGSTIIQYFVISLIDGNIELAQKVWYQIGNVQTKSVTSNIIVESPVHKPAAVSNDKLTGIASTIHSRNKSSNNNNMNIEYIEGGSIVRKYREDVVIIPCVEEFSLRARFFTLSKQGLSRALRNEDFLLRIDMEVKATCDIEILDMFLITDHNITEKPFTKQRKKFGLTYGRGQKIRDIKMLHSHRTTTEWLSQSHFESIKSNKTTSPMFSHRNSISRASVDRSLADYFTPQLASGGARKEDKFKSNLLSKIPINSTIIGSTNMLNSQMNRSLTEHDRKSGVKSIVENNIMNTSGLFHESMSTGDLVSASQMPGGSGARALVKHVYHKAIDAFTLTDHFKGFLKENAVVDLNVSSTIPVFGVYCVRWRRIDCADENESKFVIQGIEVIDPPLNIYCYLEDKMYVKVPMTLKITIRNPSRVAMRLKTCLKNSENFMFSGNTQLNISIYSYSSYDLSFNLYPLKAGWQDLPEFEIKYNTQYDQLDQQQQLMAAAATTVQSQKDPLIEDDESNMELQALVKRWMPKKVFILPMHLVHQ